MKRLIMVILSVTMILSLVGCGEKTIPELTDAEKFAEKNGISVELARSIEDALSQTAVTPSLNVLNKWKQVDDYAEGQRYTGCIYSLVQERYYYMVFYVQGDKVVSIGDQQNGLEYIYQSKD